MTSEDIKQYTEKSFTFDCPRMVLRQNIESSARVYEGPGTVYLNDEGELLFKLYSTGPPDTEILKRIFGPDALKAGEVVPRTEYFTLEATSMKGANWRCDVVSPQLNQGVIGGPVATGTLYELTEETNDPNAKGDSAYLSLRFGREFDFPGNAKRITKSSLNDVERGFSGDWTSASFRVAGLEFEFHKDHGGVFVSAESTAPKLPAHLDLRICESLEFTFFQHERWVIRVVTEGNRYKTTLRPFQKPSKRSHFHPLRFGSSSPFDCPVWILFGAYLQFVLKNDKPKWHALSENIHLAVMADAGSLESRLIGLSVALEGVVKTGYPTVAHPDALHLAQIETASKLIEESSLDDSFKKRVAGVFGAMESPRAKDKLLAFVDAGIIRPELVRAWSGMRNSAVHASGLDPAEIESVYKEYQTALTLLNELVMLLIDYRGPYTDYSVAGWPQREWTGSLENTESRPTPPNQTTGDRPQIGQSTDSPSLISPRCPASSEAVSPVANQIRRTDPE
jgi:hypothetical protein